MFYGSIPLKTSNQSVNIINLKYILKLNPALVEKGKEIVAVPKYFQKVVIKTKKKMIKKIFLVLREKFL